ncbi:hypothetical protein ACE400_29440, partial [Salmonella enterica]|uniref:hypothetical protein n=1 Tax=Salmonella enterica TaxID=28901 RepID=UPI003D2C84D8
PAIINKSYAQISCRKSRNNDAKYININYYINESDRCSTENAKDYTMSAISFTVQYIAVLAGASPNFLSLGGGFI